MCDTMVALGHTTRDGKVLFAKNSDRQPNEPHLLIHVPRRRYRPGSKVRCTYIEIDQCQETYEVFLLKPSWIWGCEMGANEFGLNIGNEAVFTRERYGEPALTGMDMIRLALERCRSSDEALEFIISLLGRYGQGGNCGYEKKFTYHNSFLIADKSKAWVLETAGRYWAAEKVKGVRSISNCLSIGKSFDMAHPELVSHAIEKGWCRSEEDFDFARCYSDPLFTYFSGARTRQETTQSRLEENLGSIDTRLLRDILRSHHPSVDGHQYERASLKSVCMHGGAPIGDHTTGSYVASLGSNCTYWVTGSSTPCLSLFKPLWLNIKEGIPFTEEKTDRALDFWRKREMLHRMVIAHQLQSLAEYLAERDRLEESWMRMVDSMDQDPGSYSEMKRIMELAWEQEEDLIARTLKESESNPPWWKGNPYHRYYWRRQTSRL
ncbi:MAG: carcinine hydrolase/isopenicillin-N N-acyltransferase family protein [Bacillota bacterium]